MKLKTFVAVLLLGTSGAHAALINMGDVTQDDETGLEWLDLSFTVGRSYNDVSSSLGAIYRGGWRYATPEEVDRFVTHITGVAFASPGWSETYEGNTDAVAAYVGYSAQDSRDHLYGITGAAWDARRQYVYGLVDSNSNYLATMDLRSPEFYAYTTAEHDQIGSWLVRSYSTATVPEPGSLALLGAGFLGLVTMRTKRARAGCEGV